MASSFPNDLERKGIPVLSRRTDPRPACVHRLPHCVPGHPDRIPDDLPGTRCGRGSRGGSGEVRRTGERIRCTRLRAIPSTGRPKRPRCGIEPNTAENQNPSEYPAGLAPGNAQAVIENTLLRRSRPGQTLRGRRLASRRPWDAPPGR
jgi:hypothetical protein